MLSAVAARKARLQATLATTQETQKPASKAPAAPVTHSKPPSKRKSSQTAGAASPVKRSRKSTSRSRSEKKNGLQSKVPAPDAPNPFVSQEDVIFLDESGGDSDASMDSGQEGAPLRSTSRPAEPVQRGRRKAWSPSRPVVDSSDEDSGDEEPAVDLSQLIFQNRPPAEEPEIISTYRPIPDQNLFRLSSAEGSHLGLTEGAVALILPPPTTVSFVGTYKLRVLHGSVSILGATLRPSDSLHHVFAPRSSPIPVIQALASRGESSRSAGSDVPPRIQNNLNESDVVIVLQELRTGVEGLGRIVRTFEGVFEGAKSDRNSFDMPLEGVHLITETVRGMHAFHLHPSWEDALSTSISALDAERDGLPKPYIGLVRGQKNSGKSTFARTLVNRLVSRYRRVAFLECDLGQSEFTPGGMVALSIVERPILGPPFTHPALPHQAHYIGAHNPRAMPAHYLRAIEALLETYRLDLQHATALADAADEAAASDDARIADAIPLVVNTMGWTRGLGADLGRRIEALAQPNAIFSLDADAPADGPAQHVHALAPATPSARFTASDHRALALLSYFHAVFPAAPSPGAPPRQLTAGAWRTDVPLCARAPYAVSARAALTGIVLAGAGAEDVVRSELPRVLAGALVGLVAAGPEDDFGAGEDDGHAGELYTPGAPPPDPGASRCIGLGLVRGVSGAADAELQLQLLTPVPRGALGGARVLVMGELGLPVWGWLDFRAADGSGAGAEVPFLRWGRGAGAGSERRRVRRNILRRGQA
ncbi:hypothetical protein BC834DRAFT_866034 [Gloeopeniophorella convolvens]|nr:hypothetical protein BC834DRAFT_866034 [Gloeopeniophorella convolvens]